MPSDHKNPFERISDEFVKNQNQGQSRFKSGRLADHYYNSRRASNTEQFPSNNAQRKKVKEQNIFQSESVLDSEDDLETSVRPSYVQHAKSELSDSEPVFPDSGQLQHGLPEQIIPFNERYMLDWISKPTAVYKSGMRK